MRHCQVAKTVQHSRLALPATCDTGSARARGIGYQTRLVGDGKRQAGVLKGISAGTDGYAACQRPLNFKRVRLPIGPDGEGDRETSGRERRDEREVTSAQVDPPPRNRARNRPGALTSIYKSALLCGGSRPHHLLFIVLLIRPSLAGG